MRTAIKFEKRPTHGWLASVFSTCVAILLALLASSVLLWIVDVDVYGAFHALVLGAFGDLDSIYGTCVKAIPLAFTGLATGIAFRARIWNIGQEGQVFAGAMLGYWLSITIVDWPGIVFFPPPHRRRICRRGHAGRARGRPENQVQGRRDRLDGDDELHHRVRPVVSPDQPPVDGAGRVLSPDRTDTRRRREFRSWWKARS